MDVTAFWVLLFGTAFVVQSTYWLLFHHGFRQAVRQAASGSDEPMPPISVVVAARDEAENLPGLLAALTQQSHPCYEIILVDDASTDATPEIVRAWQREHRALRLIQVETPKAPRKKQALTLGIEAATYDLLALTDADCTPPPDWLATLARHHAGAPGACVLIGYSPFRAAPGLLNRLARYETFVTGFFTAAAAGLGRPYMAVGRNLSYPRPLFARIDGFADSIHALSGDDDLFVQAVARRRAAELHPVLDADTFVPSRAPSSWQAWVHQKRRHLSAGRYYDRRTQTHLTLFHATGIGLWMAPVVLGWAGLGLLVAKLILQRIVLREAAAVLHESDLLPTQPVLELLYTAYTLVIAPLGLARTPRRW